MKRSFLLFLLVFYPIILLCQNSNKMLLNSRIEYDWDSETDNWINFVRYDYVHDANGNPTEKITHQWNSKTNDWVFGSRFVYRYNANGNLTEHIEYYWDSEINDWVFDSSFVYTYDAKGNKTEEIHYKRDSEINEWVFGSRFVYTYDDNENLIEEINYEWNKEHNDWIENSRITLSYDAKGNKISEMNGLDKITFAYDSIGNIIEEANYLWDQKTNEWKESERVCHNGCTGGRYLYRYDSIGNMVESIYFDWDKNEWVAPQSTFYIYESNGNLLRENGYGPGSNEPVKIRNDYYYDSLGNQTEHIHYYWDYDVIDFVEDFRYVYKYDADGNQTEEIYYNLDSEKYDWIPFSKTVSQWSYHLVFSKTFYVDENCIDTTIIDSLITGSNYPRENIVLRNIANDEQNRFALDAITGNFTFNASNLDFETTPIYRIKVEAQFEDSTRKITEEAVITIHVNNLNDNAPILNDTTLSVEENGTNYKVVGKEIASDPDGNLNNLKLTIIAGNDGHKYYINADGNLARTNRPLNYETQDTYYLTIQVSDGTFTDEAIVTINVIKDVTSAENLEVYNQFKIYPNPANDILYFEVPALFQDEFEVKINSVTGKVMLQEYGNIEQIDISGIPPGIYLVLVKSKDFGSTKKIIKQ